MMSKDQVKIVTRIVERPTPVKDAGDRPYRPAKRAVFKAIATCELAGKRLSRTATNEDEDESKRLAYNKLATLIAKSGGIPV
jgi:hypothetical protein